MKAFAAPAEDLARSGERAILRLVLDPRLGDLRLRVAPVPKLGEVPNFLSAVPPRGRWLDIQRALERFFRLAPEAKSEDAEARDMFAETLARLQRAKRPSTVDAVAYAIGVAKKVRADVLEMRERERKAIECWRAELDGSCFQTKRTTETTEEQDLRRPLHLTNDVEDSTIECVDERSARLHGPRPMIADFDRQELWREVHVFAADRCRARFGRIVGCLKDATPRQIEKMRVDGRCLTPEEGTWLYIRGLPHMPAGLVVSTTATVEDVYGRFYERVAKGFQRAKHESKQKAIFVKRVLSTGLRIPTT